MLKNKYYCDLCRREFSKEKPYGTDLTYNYCMRCTNRMSAEEVLIVLPNRW